MHDSQQLGSSAAVAEPGDPRHTELGQQVLSALASLYDAARLQTHPLATVVRARTADDRQHLSAALRQALVEVIEALRPERDADQTSPSWRSYRLMQLRYVEALDVAAVQAALAIGHSEYYREHRRALDAVVSLFRERFVAPADPLPAAAPLPVPLTSFHGRGSELERVHAILEQRRLLTLTGPPGAGKTRLALEAVMVGNVADRIHFVPLAAITEPELVLPAIAQALGVRQPGARPLLTGIADALGEGQTLLVLDNFEQVVEAGPEVVRLLQACPSLKVLATSRLSLGVAGEREFPVPPLSLPDLDDLPSLEQLEEHAAIALFVARAQDVRPDFSLTQENAAAVAAICARLDGLPLAIELAAARIKLLPPGAMLTQLESRLDFLTGGPRDRPARQQSLRAAIDGSYDLLAEPSRALFRQLAVFSGGATLDAIDAVATPVGGGRTGLLDRLGTLLDSSLLRQEPGGLEPRYLMLETIREYALERLDVSNDAVPVRDVHAAYYLALAEQHPFLFAEPSAEWLDRMEREHDNLRAALNWLVERADLVRALRLAAALGSFWFVRGHYTLGREHLSRVLSLSPDEPIPARAHALLALGSLVHAQGDDAVAQGLFEQALAIEEQTEERPAVGAALFNLSRVAVNAGDWNTARSCAERSLAIARTSGDTFGAARSLLVLGRIAYFQRDLTHARALWQESRQLFAQLGEGRGLASVLCRLGIVAADERQFVEAQAYLSESLTRYQRLAHPWGIAQALEGFAGLAAAEGDAWRAARLAGAAGALRARIGSPLSPALRSELEDRLAPARTGPHALTAEAYATAMREGEALSEALSIEDAATLALSGRTASPRWGEAREQSDHG